MLLYLLFVGLIATIASYLLTLFVRKQARRWGRGNQPDAHPEGEHSLVVSGGGLAIFLAAAGTFAAEFISSSKLQESLLEDKLFLKGLLIACAWIVMFGLFSERWGMTGRYKLVGQLAATLIMIASGLQIHAFYLFGYSIQLGASSIPITILWLLVAINALYLLDRMEGIATTVGIILCATITLIAMSLSDTAIAIVGAVIAGTLVGFLRFNLAPATIHLGDAGSMLIGLAVGALAIAGSRQVTATLGLATPIAIFAVPMLNAIAVILRSFQQGRSSPSEDCDHLNPRQMSKIGTHTAVLSVVVICCVMSSAGAILGVYLNREFLPLGSVLLVFFVLRFSGLLGTGKTVP